MLQYLLGFLSVIFVGCLYLASTDIPPNLAPQGCRMSWMSPSYLLQDDFNASWTPLSGRYSLWLYREVGWDVSDKPDGLPVLFIPGNAGSSHQVRSIASSAARQYYDSPYRPSAEYASSKPLDFFAVEFNEDLSAFHGPTLDSERAYSSAALEYIQSLYPRGTPVLVLGHSMGGIVAVSLLPDAHAHISLIITMSTPHTLAPARSENRIEAIFAQHHHLLQHHPTPILSLCGGATDNMVASEFCALPEPKVEGLYRHTVFTSALEGAWTGVGHREMVWCHQVRWRVARAALELARYGQSPVSISAKTGTLDRWFRDGSTLPLVEARSAEELSHAGLVTLRQSERLVVQQPQGVASYLLPVPSPRGTEERRFVLLLSGGSIPPISPHTAIPLRASVDHCLSPGASASASPANLKCSPLAPSALRLLPFVNHSRPFPIPGEGSDESEGVVLFEAVLEVWPGESEWIRVTLSDGDRRGWLVAGFESHIGTHFASSLKPFYGTISAPVDPSALRTQIYLPNMLSNALLVYRLTAESNSCSDLLMPPLIAHRALAATTETQYFPLLHPSHPVAYLHSHASGPFLPPLDPKSKGIDLTIYSSADRSCGVTGLRITVDWWMSVGRLGMRYWPTIPAWCVGVVGWIVAAGMKVHITHGRSMPTVGTSLRIFIRQGLPKICTGLFFISLLPLPPSFLLGNGGEWLFAPLAPLFFVISTGLVCVSWSMLTALMWPLSVLARRNMASDKPTAHIFSRSDALTLVAICLLIFILVPWQVAFMGCWMVHLYTCATSAPTATLSPPPAAARLSDSSIPVPLLKEAESPPTPSSNGDGQTKANGHHLNKHILLLMTWLLLPVAPILAVWVRTLATAGLATPFDGDHNFLNILPFLIVTDLAGRSGDLTNLWKKDRVIGMHWLMHCLLPFCILLGTRHMSNVFDVVNVILCAGFTIPLLARFRPGPG